MGRTCFAASAMSFFSFAHMVNKAFRLVSYALSLCIESSVSLNICDTLGSRPCRSRCLTVSANCLSMFLVKEAPGLSARILMSMTALYWTWGRS